MNLKDRLIIAKQNNITSENKENLLDISDIFVNADETSDILRSIFSDNKNVIFMSDRSIGNDVYINFIQLLIKEKQVHLLETCEENLLSSSKINVIRNQALKDCVKLYEASIAGYYSIAAILKLNNNNNVIDKIKSVIALNHPNLTENNINLLIKESQYTYVWAEKYNGKLIISCIFETNDGNTIQVRYSYFNNDFQNNKTEEEKKEKTKSIDEELLNYSSAKIIQEKNKQEENIQQHEENPIPQTNTEKNVENEKISNKVNKYKLLREKVLAKRNKQF